MDTTWEDFGSKRSVFIEKSEDSVVHAGVEAVFHPTLCIGTLI